MKEKFGFLRRELSWEEMRLVSGGSKAGGPRGGGDGGIGGSDAEGGGGEGGARQRGGGGE